MFATIQKFHVLPAILAAKSSLNATTTIYNRRLCRNHGFLFNSRPYSSEKPDKNSGKCKENKKSEKTLANATASSDNNNNNPCGGRTQLNTKPNCPKKNFCKKIVETERKNPACNMPTKKETEKVSVNCKFEASGAKSASKTSKSCQQLSETPSDSKCGEKKLSQSTCNLDAVKCAIEKACMRQTEESTKKCDKPSLASFSTCTKCARNIKGNKLYMKQTPTITGQRPLSDSHKNKGGESKEKNSCNKSKQPSSSADCAKPKSKGAACNLPKRADQCYEKSKMESKLKLPRSATDCRNNRKKSPTECIRTAKSAEKLRKCEKPTKPAAAECVVKPEPPPSQKSAEPCKSQAKTEPPKAAEPCESKASKCEPPPTKSAELCKPNAKSQPPKVAESCKLSAKSEPPKANESCKSQASSTSLSPKSSKTDLPKKAISCRRKKSPEPCGKPKKEIAKPSKCEEIKQVASKCETPKPKEACQLPKPAAATCPEPKTKALTKCETSKPKETTKPSTLMCEIPKPTKVATTKCEEAKKVTPAKCEKSKSPESCKPADSAKCEKPKTAEMAKCEKPKPAEMAKCEKPKTADFAKCELTKQKAPSKCEPPKPKDCGKPAAKCEQKAEPTKCELNKPKEPPKKCEQAKPSAPVVILKCDEPKKEAPAKCEVSKPQEATKSPCEKPKETAPSPCGNAGAQESKTKKSKTKCRTVKAVASYTIMKTKGNSKCGKPAKPTEKKCEKASSPTPAAETAKCDIVIVTPPPKETKTCERPTPEPVKSESPKPTSTCNKSPKAEANKKCNLSKAPTHKKPGKTGKAVKTAKSIASLREVQPRYIRVRKCKSDKSIKSSESTCAETPKSPESDKCPEMKAPEVDDKCKTANKPSGPKCKKPEPTCDKPEPTCGKPEPSCGKPEPTCGNPEPTCAKPESPKPASCTASVEKPTDETDTKTCNDPCTKLKSSKGNKCQNHKKTDAMGLAAAKGASRPGSGGFGGGCKSSGSDGTETYHASSSTYRKISMLTLLAVAVLCGYTYLHIDHHERPEFTAYEYMRRRNKRFPWGDGQKSYFHNPEVNALPDGYETDEEE